MAIRSRASRYLIASFATAGISLLTLPLTTRILGPRDYGLLALGSTLAGVGGVLSTLGISYLLANQWSRTDLSQRRALVPTILISGTGVGLAWATVASVSYLALHDRVSFLGEVPGAGLTLLLLGMFAAPWGTLTAEVLTLEGRAGLFATSAVLQALVIATTTLVSLYAFDLRTLSLFVGLAAGSVASLLIGVVVLRPFLAPRFDSGWRRALAQSSFLPAQLAESTYPVVERVLLSRYVGFAELGLYTHSQRYRALLQQATKAVSRGVWPVTLEEARQVEGRFPLTQRTWTALHVAVTAIALAVTLLGDFLISLLTNGKFTNAWVYLGPWLILLLLEISAKPETGTLYTFGRGTAVARLTLVSSLAALTTAVVLIPLVGAAGAVLALTVQALFYRVWIRFPTRRYRSVPFQDHWVAVGIAFVLAAWSVKFALGQALGPSLIAAVAFEAVFLVLASRVISQTLGTLPRFGATKAGPI